MEHDKEKDVEALMSDEGEDEAAFEETDLNEDEGEAREVKEQADKEIGTDLKPQMNAKKAIGMASILIFGILVIILGGLRLNNLIGESFVGYGQEGGGSGGDLDSEQMLAMQRMDTDKDGLSDYDEIYVYKTSAYIDDTDSDGFGDGEEVAQGEDPLCPTGSDCYGGEQGEDGELRMEDGDGDGGVNVGEVDLEEVRRLLILGGADEEAVNSMDDASLLEMYQEIVLETGIDPFKVVEDTGNSAELMVDDVRKILIEAGVDEATVNSVDDEMLMEIYWETMAEMD